MKINKFYSATLVGLLGLWTLASCRQSEDLAPRTPENPQENVTVLSLDATSGLETEELIMQMKSEMRALTLEGDVTDHNAVPRLKDMTAGDKVNVHFYITDGTNKSYNPLQFEVKLIDGVKKLYYKGNITVTNFDKNKEWYASAIIGGVIENGKHAYQPQAYLITGKRSLAVGSGNGELNIPFVTQWQKVVISPSGQMVGFKSNFKPFGHLLRLRVENKKDDKDFWFKGFQVQSEDFSTDIAINTNADLATLKSGAYPKMERRNANALCHVPGVNEIKSLQKSGIMWLWVAPLNPTATAITVQVVGGKQGGEWRYPYNFSLKAGSGVSSFKNFKINKDFKVYRLVYLLDHLERGNLKNDGSLAAEGVQGDLFSVKKLSQASFYGDLGANGRRIMTAGDWVSIMPSSNHDVSGPSTTASNYNGAANRDGHRFFTKDAGYDLERTEDIWVYYNGEFSRRDGSKANYRITSNNMFYGLRHQTTDNSHLSAWRYTMDPEGGIYVEMVHLGPNWQGDLNTISNDAWWTEAGRFDEITTRYFPFRPAGGNYEYCYYMGLAGVSINVENEAFLWNRQYGRMAHRLDIGNWASGNHWGDFYHQQVRLFNKKTQPHRK